ncbi:M56 family metallopeptidase [bacterium]|nr:M56 family metallopeptidase [bacterium]
MSSFIEYISSPNHSVSMWLLGVAFKVTIVLAVAAICCRILRGQSAAVRHRAWLMSLLVSLLIPLSVGVMPSFEFVPLPDLLSQRDNAHENETAFANVVAASPREVSTVQSSASSQSEEVSPETPPRDTTVTVDAATSVILPSVVLPDTRSPILEQNDTASNGWSILLCVWICGSCVVFTSFLWALCVQYRRHRRLQLVTDDEWLAAIAHQSRRLGLRRLVKTFESTHGEVPAIYGLLRPYLVIPKDWQSWSDEQRACILLHELAHMKRRDLAAQFVGRMAVALHWYNPLAWYAIKQLRLERELACDDCVLMAGQRPSVYAEQLLQTLKMYRSNRVTLGVAMAHSARIDQRIVSILDVSRRRLPMNTRTVAVCLVCSLALTAGLGATAFSTNAAKAQTINSATNQEVGDPEFAALFNGLVTGPDGKPFKGAEIYIVPMNASPDFLEPVRVRAVTDVNGRFKFEAPDMTIVDLDGFRTRKRCTVIATADGYGPDWRGVAGGWRSWSIRNLIKGTNLSLQLVSDDVPLRGRLLDADGQPLAAARVRLEELLIPKQEDLDVQLKREVEVRQNPLGVVFVGSMGYERSLRGPNLEALRETEVRTDVDGRFTMTGLGNERLIRLRVSAQPVIDSELMAVTREMPDLTFQSEPNDPDRDTSREISGTIRGADFTVKLQRGLTVKGMVIDRETRQPISGMQMGTRRDRKDDLVNGRIDSNVTDSNGQFTITGLDPKILTYKEEHRRLVAVSQPGQFYGTGSGTIEANGQVLIECSRGIPFHLNIVDEEGIPVEAIVRTIVVSPNRQMDYARYQSGGTISRAVINPDKSYTGFVLPGPGAILVKTPANAGYRPDHVDPKNEFAPGRTEWTAQEKISTYGTHDTVMGQGVWYSQHDYSAILLTNAKQGANRLELKATVVKDRPRQITIVDPENQPIIGVKTRGLSFHPWDTEPSLRTATFPINGLHPDRSQRIQFFHEERQLIGFLVARGNDDSPITVRMQPWGAVTGRLIDDSGQPLGGTILTAGSSGTVTQPDDTIGDNVGTKTDADGHFRINKLIPGLSYTVLAYPRRGHLLGAAFENLVIEPGEIREFGDINPDQ